MSSDSKFTPGPYYRGHAEVGQQLDVFDPSGVRVCRASRRPEADANANLFMASAELYDALDAMISMAPIGSCDSFHHAKKDQHSSLDDCPVMERWRLAINSGFAALRKADGGTDDSK